MASLSLKRCILKFHVKGFAAQAKPLEETILVWDSNTQEVRGLACSRTCGVPGHQAVKWLPLICNTDTMLLV